LFTGDRYSRSYVIIELHKVNNCINEVKNDGNTELFILIKSALKQTFLKLLYKKTKKEKNDCGASVTRSFRSGIDIFGEIVLMLECP
jgi:hypothetical protein